MYETVLRNVADRLAPQHIVCIEIRIVRLHGSTPSAASRSGNVACWSAAIVQLAVLLINVPRFIQPGVDFGVTDDENLEDDVASTRSKS